MSTLGWKIWILPLALWGLYTCWYCGYQSGYADGHITAWNLYRPGEFVINDIARLEAVPEPEANEITPVSAIR